MHVLGILQFSPLFYDFCANFLIFVSFCVIQRARRLAEWLRRRGASLGVPGSTPGAGNSLAARYRPFSKAVNAKVTLATYLSSDIYYLVGDIKGIRP